MGKLVYDLIVRFYNLALYFASFSNKKAKKILRGRKESFRLVSGTAGLQDRNPVIWFHCASLGEFEQGRPVMEAIKKEFPNCRIFLSFFSSSGLEVQKRTELADCVFYLPADTEKNATNLIEIMSPSLALFVKYEFWYHFINACHLRRIPVVSISTILRADQIFFKRAGTFYREILCLFDHFFVQDENTRKLLLRSGIHKVTLSGDTRFDRVYKLGHNRGRFPVIEEFIADKKCIILGSTWKPDIQLWKDFINMHNHDLKFIIAPHQIEPSDIAGIENLFKTGTVRYSQSVSVHLHDRSIMIIDNVGMLSGLYNYADIAYVGGSFSGGLHNILEPATFGRPVILGQNPSNKKYREAGEMVNLSAAFEVSGEEQLNAIVEKLLHDPQFYDIASRQASGYIRDHTGATAKIMAYLKEKLKKYDRAGY